MGIISKIKLYKLYKKLNINKNDVKIDENQYIYANVLFKGLAYIGPNILMSGFGKIEIGNNTIIGPNVEIMTSVHNYNTDLLPYDGSKDITKDVIIGDNVWIGSSVIIMPGVRIGDGAVIGAKSFVNSDVPFCSISVGTPNKVIKYRNINKYKELSKMGKLYLKQKYNSSKN